jgi:hypothetical protein
MVSIMDMF